MMKNLKMVVICGVLLIVAGGIYTQRMQSVEQETPKENVIWVDTFTAEEKGRLEDSVFTVTRETENESTTEWWWRDLCTGKEEMKSSLTLKKPENLFAEWERQVSYDENAATVVTVDLTSEEKIFP